MPRPERLPATTWKPAIAGSGRRGTWRAARRLGPLVAALLLLAVAPPPQASLYQTVFVVTGTGAANRAFGFGQCLNYVLEKVSGDRRLATDPAVAELMKNAASFVAGYGYLDLKSGVPIHDEQGSYDRPQYLIADFDPAKIDAALKSLGRKPWLDRPRLAVFLGVEREPKSYVVVADDDRDAAMREAFANASRRFGVALAFPDHALVAARLPDFAAAKSADADALGDAAKSAGGDVALLGTLAWSDRDHGWIADWQVSAAGKPYRWEVRGVNFDDAFRNGVSGAAQVLSGNGQPD